MFINKKQELQVTMNLNQVNEISEKARKYDELIKLDGKVELSCSFCGKSQSAVYRLIAGKYVYICSECIDLCTEILKEERIKEENNTDEENKEVNNENVLP